MALNSPIADWRGRTVWLVGASTGIGRATASALHAQGANVVVSARNADALRAFADAHAGALALPLDVTDTSAVKAMASALAARGALDCVLYCAGHYHAMDALHMDLGDMVRHNEVNYLGALRVLDAVLPHLLAQPPDGRTGQRGHISLMGSVAGYRGLPNSLAYGPTKAALINLAESLKYMFEKAGLTISVCNPGFVETPLTDGNRFPMPFLMKVDDAAAALQRGIYKHKFEIAFPTRFVLLLKFFRCMPYWAYFPLIKRMTG